MNRQQIDALVKTMNVDTATGSVDARTQQLGYLFNKGMALFCAKSSN